jgi:hypothetical protein
MMMADLESVRWSQRVALGQATIDGVSIADKGKALEIAAKVVDFRESIAATAIRHAIANRERRPPD